MKTKFLGILMVLLVGCQAFCAEPTFTVSGMTVEGKTLIVRYDPVFPIGMDGVWDPEAVKAKIARLVTILDGNWVWGNYKPGLAPEQPIPPVVVLIESFSLNPTTIEKGKSALLVWAAPKAKSASLNGSTVGVSGTLMVSPFVTTTYMLAVTDGTKVETSQRTLTVIDTPTPLPIDALKKLVVEAGMKLPVTVKTTAPIMSQVYILLASKGIPDPIDSVEKLIIATKAAREFALGPAAAAAWQPWVNEVGKWLDTNKASFPDMNAWKSVWIAIGESLKEVK